jgi:hypothetical protein
VLYPLSYRRKLKLINYNVIPMEYRIELSRRLTVEMPVADPQLLLDLQTRLWSRLSGFRPKTSDFHLTVYHFGLPGQIYAALRRRHPDLARSSFDSQLRQMLHRTAHLLPPLTLPATGLIRLGNPRDPVLALQLETNPTLLAANQAADRAFQAFIAACGLPWSDYRRSHPAKPYLPHVSLGRLPARAVLSGLEPLRLDVKLNSSRLRNVEMSDESVA